MIIEIVRTPAGSSPVWVREAWVGMKLKSLVDAPIDVPTVTGAGRGGKLGALWQMATGRAVMRRGYTVNARDAIGLLALNNEDAALWRIEHTPGALNPSQVLLFEESCCRPVD